MVKEESICTVCGYIGFSKKVTKGSFLMEVALWILFLLPGIIYSIWRLTSRYDACPKCKNASLIPVNSPKGQELLKNQQT